MYAHHWLPFLSSQPAGADPYGAVARDPSFLYHYVMSFPYRIIELCTHSQTAQIIILRLINIALFVSGLILFRKVLRRTGLSSITTNVSILITTLIPVGSQLAGQINYDNLLIPMTAWACLLTFDAIDQQQKRRSAVQTLLGLMSVCLAASMVKYEFLPIFLGIGIFLLVFAWRQMKGRWHSAWRQAVKDWRKGGATKWLLAVVFLAAFGLFVQRDVGNVLMYHTVAPDCSQVLDINHCSAYSVWVHDHQSHQAVVDQVAYVNPNPLTYFCEWVYWLWYRLFFTINGPASDFTNYPPLPLPAAAFALLLTASAMALIVRGRKTFAGKPYVILLGVVTMVYLLTLFGAGYLKYRQTGVLELMNGRYLFPILLPGAAVAALALSVFTSRVPVRVRYGLTAALLFCFLEGGGVLTFISRSDPAWYWPNTTVRQMNATAKAIFAPVIIDGPHMYSTDRWFFN